jgi:hypothetical protein
MRHDNVIYSLFNGRMTKTGTPKFPLHYANFLIICEYGDWSGFRSLADCEAQFPELEAAGRPNFFYQVVERL